MIRPLNHRFWPVQARFVALLPTALAIVAMFCSSSLTAADRQSPVAQQGVLLLSNGEVLQGQISRQGDQFEISLPLGRIQLRASEVEFCCASIEEAYLRKRSLVSPASPADQLRLAQWCHRQELFGPAAHHLERAEALAPGHPMIPLLRRRLEVATRPPASSTSPDSSSPEAADEATGPSVEDLERMTENLPRGVVQTFVRDVQPLLLNYCTSAGCHGPRSETGLSLLRTRPGSFPTRRLNQRNLHAVLQWVDREQPEASPLLTAPTRAHGTAAAAIFTDRQVAQYRMLVNWVARVSGDRSTAALATTRQARPRSEKDAPTVDPFVTPAQAIEPVGAEEPTGESNQNRASAGVGSGSSPAREAPAVRRAVFEAVDRYQTTLPSANPSPEDGLHHADATAGEEAPSVETEGRQAEASSGQVQQPRAASELSRTGPVGQPADPRLGRRRTVRSGDPKRGTPMPGYRPRDPFDPEIFNRRYFGTPTEKQEDRPEQPEDSGRTAPDSQAEASASHAAQRPTRAADRPPLDGKTRPAQVDLDR
jgi:hypothetical protein